MNYIDWELVDLYPSLWPGTLPGWGGRGATLHKQDGGTPILTWDIVPPVRTGWGTPCLDLGWGYFPSPSWNIMGVPPLVLDGVPPVLTTVWTDTRTCVKTLPSLRTPYTDSNYNNCIQRFLKPLANLGHIMSNGVNVFSVFHGFCNSFESWNMKNFNMKALNFEIVKHLPFEFFWNVVIVWFNLVRFWYSDGPVHSHSI